MSVNSLKAINKVLSQEGGFVNNASDHGGPTNFGITQKVYEAFIGRPATLTEIKNMPIGNAIAIYQKNYWDAIGGDYINSYAVAYTIFDQAVNRGVGSAIQQICSVLGISKSATISNTILSALNRADPETFVSDYLDASEEFYGAIISRDPSQEQFYDGWINRLDKIRNYAEANFGKAVAIVKETLQDNPWIYLIPVLAIGGVVTYYYLNKEKSHGTKLVTV